MHGTIGVYECVPRLPSLLAGMGQLDILLLFGVFMTSAVLGDAVNYAIGKQLGE